MELRKTTLHFFALSLLVGGSAACAPAAHPEPAAVPDIRASVASLGIPACDAYVSALEDACFGPSGHAFPPALFGLVANRVEGWHRDAGEPGGRARVAVGCATASDEVHTFHCDVR